MPPSMIMMVNFSHFPSSKKLGEEIETVCFFLVDRLGHRFWLVLVPHLQTHSLLESTRKLQKFGEAEKVGEPLKAGGSCKSLQMKVQVWMTKKKHMCKHQKSLGYLGLCCSQWGDNLTAHSKSFYSAHKLSNKTSTTPRLWAWVGMLLQRTIEGYTGSYLGRCQELLCTDSFCKIHKTILQIHMKTIT